MSDEQEKPIDQFEDIGDLLENEILKSAEEEARKVLKKSASKKKGRGKAKEQEGSTHSANLGPKPETLSSQWEGLIKAKFPKSDKFSIYWGRGMPYDASKKFGFTPSELIIACFETEAAVPKVRDYVNVQPSALEPLRIAKSLTCDSCDVYLTVGFVKLEFMMQAKLQRINPLLTVKFGEGREAVYLCLGLCNTQGGSMVLESELNCDNIVRHLIHKKVRPFVPVPTVPTSMAKATDNYKKGQKQTFKRTAQKD